MRGSSTLTLRRVWVISLLQLVTVVVGVSGLAVGATWYSGKLFHGAVFASEEQMTSVTSLKAALVEMSITATPVMYGLNGPRTADENVLAYTAAAERLTRKLEAAGTAFADPESREILRKMVDSWRGIDAVIASAPDLLASGSLAEVVASGSDPFQTMIWTPYNEMDGQLSQLSNEAVGELRARIAAYDRVHDLMVAAVVASVGVALGMSFVTARRVSRRVLLPLSMLRTAAVALSESGTAGPIVLTGAALELHELAQTINETRFHCGRGTVNYGTKPALTRSPGFPTDADSPRCWSARWQILPMTVWPCCSSILTTSRSSTTPSATPPATSCCVS